MFSFLHRALGGYNRGFAAQAVYNPRRKSSNFKRIAVNFNFITNGRTLGARTPLAFKNSPPFDKRTVPPLFERRHSLRRNSGVFYTLKS